MTKRATDVELRTLRARTLAGRIPQSSEPLTFYVNLLGLQDAVAADHPRVLRLPASFAAALDVEAAADALPFLLKGLLAFAPSAVTTAARHLLTESHAEWRHLVHMCWAGERDGDPLRLFLAEALLQPFAEIAAADTGRAATLSSGFGTGDTVPADAATAAGRDPGLGTGHPEAANVAVAGDSGPGTRDPKAVVGAAFRPPDTQVCGVCGDRPVVAVLREEAHGARRSLICGFCLSEWPAPRLACLQCGERQFEKLAVYRAEELPGVRIDACDTCRTYLKTVDLTQDATGVPVVDDIASVALDLWARGQGYRRLRPNLLRL